MPKYVANAGYAIHAKFNHPLAAGTIYDLTQRNAVINLKQIKVVAWLAGLLAVFVIAILSLVPGHMRPHTGMPKELEHVVAYLLTAGLLTFGYGKSRYPTVFVFFLSFYSAGLEIAQLGIPGRTGNFEDFIVSSIGALLGSTIAWFVLRTFPRSE